MPSRKKKENVLEKKRGGFPSPHKEIRDRFGKEKSNSNRGERGLQKKESKICFGKERERAFHCERGVGGGGEKRKKFL